jgi:uncharacterized protein
VGIVRSPAHLAIATSLRHRVTHLPDCDLCRRDSLEHKSGPLHMIGIECGVSTGGGLPSSERMLGLGDCSGPEQLFWRRSEMNVDIIQRTISVTGVGRAAAVADIVLLDLAVETRAVAASEALAKNNKQTTAVRTALKDHNIQERDIQTTQLSINPVFARQGLDDAGPPKITGYQARNGMSVRLRDLQGAGAVIDAAVQAGGDAIRIEGISFSFADPSSLLVEARKRAIENARDRAQQLADGFGVGLGNVTSISESDFSGQRSFLESAASSFADTPISPGESEITIQITVEHEIFAK